MTFHPWRHLSRTDIRQIFEAEPDLLGSWDLPERTIRLHPKLSQVQRRCTLTHELVHAELEHDGEQDAYTEALVSAEAARRLIPIRALAEAALIFEDDISGIADHLWVDEDTLHARLDRRFMHPSEAGYLARRLAAKERSA